MSRDPVEHELHEDELSAEEMRQLRGRRLKRRLLVYGLPAAATLSLVVALAVPLIKNWRARQFAERADSLRAQGKLQEAFNNASSALQMRPGLPEIQRAYARVMFAAKEPAGLQVMQQLIDSGEATPEDRLELAEACLRFGDIPLAEREAFHLMQNGQKTPEALHVLARVRLAQRRTADALQALQESVEAGGGHEPALLLARLKIASNDPSALSSALDLLRPLARQNDQAGLDALLVLVDSPALKSDEGPGWVAALRSHPMASDTQKLAAASAEILLQPSSSAEVVRRTVDSYRQATPDQRVELGRWLNQQRRYDAVLDAISAGEALTRSDLFLIRLDAMAGRKDWQALAVLLAGDKLPLSNAVVQLYRGRASRELGKPEEAATFYRRAVVESAPSPDVMWYVIEYLQRIGEEQVLEQELRRLTDNPASARQAFASLVPIVQKRQDAGELYELYDNMLKRLPADPTVQNDHRYFAALTAHRSDVSGARELMAKEPRMLSYRVTLALTLLKSGQNAAALQVFDGITLDPAEIQPYQRTVIAAVLGANGREAEARELARSVAGDSVTVQELELIAPWRESLTEPGTSVEQGAR